MIMFVIIFKKYSKTPLIPLQTVIAIWKVQLMKFVTRNKVFACAKKVMEEFVVISVALVIITIRTV